MQDAWDSYIQGPGIDAQNNFFPMDLGGMPMQTDASGLQNPPVSNAQPQSQRTNAFGQNVFMGVSEP
jgi:hypothetical protein